MYLKLHMLQLLIMIYYMLHMKSYKSLIYIIDNNKHL